MDPYSAALSAILSIVKKYWWVALVLVGLIYIYILRGSIYTKDKLIQKQVDIIARLELDVSTFKTKIEIQNRAIDELTQKGKEQATRLDNAIAKVNAMKPATQVIIREIYSDKTKDIEQLLLNAVND